jgi:hypothetical protein
MLHMSVNTPYSERSSDQISKILNVASTKLGNIDTNIDSINTRIEEVDKKGGYWG